MQIYAEHITAELDVVVLVRLDRDWTQWHNAHSNKAVTDCRLRPWCCHLWSYFKHTSFSCRHISRDIMCKHDVINIQHAHCSPDCKLPACNGYSYAPSPRLRVSLAASAWRRHRATSAYEQNTTSSTKPEIRNISLRRQTEEDRATAIGNMHKILGEDRTLVPKIWSRTDKHTHTDRQTRSSQYSAPLLGAEKQF